MSIGVEPVAAPMALFLDEPTTGLDAATSLHLCTLLKDVAIRASVSVAMVIHQPRAEIFNALDEILILAPGGFTVYQGPQRESVAYFQERGISFSPQCNPADVIMDAVAERGAELARAWIEFATARADEGASVLCVNAVSAPRAVGDDAKAYSVTSAADLPAAQAPGFVRQCLVFHVRRAEKQLSQWSDVIVELLVIGVCGLVIGQAISGFFVQSPYKAPYKAISPLPFDSLAYLHLYMMMALGLGASVAGVNIFGRERLSYFRDAQAGCNRLAYFVGTALASVYRVLLGGLVFSTLVHGIGRLMIPFSVVFGALTLNYFAVYAMACAVSIVASERDSPVIAATLSILMAVFSGAISFPRGLKVLSPTFWGSQVMHQYHDDFATDYAEPTMGTWGYARGEVEASFAMCFVWGFVYLCVAAILMFVTNRPGSDEAATLCSVVLGFVPAA
jgi:hypothetical protein